MKILKFSLFLIFISLNYLSAQNLFQACYQDNNPNDYPKRHFISGLQVNNNNCVAFSLLQEQSHKIIFGDNELTENAYGNYYYINWDTTTNEINYEKPIQGRGYKYFKAKKANDSTLIIAGYFTGDTILIADSMIFNPGLSAYFGVYDIAVASINLNTNNYNWIWSPDGVSDSPIYKLNIDDTGNIYIIGYTQRTLKFTETDSIIPPYGGRNSYIAKFTPSGKFLWAKTPQVPDFAFVFMHDIKVHNDKIYATGHATSLIYYDSIKVTNGYSNYDATMHAYGGFILATDTAGNYQWSHQIWAKFYPAPYDPGSSVRWPKIAIDKIGNPIIYTYWYGDNPTTYLMHDDDTMYIDGARRTPPPAKHLKTGKLQPLCCV